MSSASTAIAEKLVEAEIVGRIREAIMQRGLTAEVTYGEATSNSAVQVNVDGPGALGRLTWWSDGSFHAEAVRASDEVQLLSRHGVAMNTLEALAALEEVFEQIAQHP